MGHDYIFFDSNDGLRGYKRDLYDGGIRVPMIVFWPGHIKPNTVSNFPSAFWDYLPTACDLAGIELLQKVDGVSYLPTLLGKKQPPRNYLFWKSSDKGDGTQVAVRYGKWKGIRMDYTKPVELYDLTKDKSETHNEAEKYPDVVKKIESIMREADTTAPR